MGAAPAWRRAKDAVAVPAKALGPNAGTAVPGGGHEIWQGPGVGFHWD